ncbi:MAG: nicotinate-nucleotide adenylyltransferase [Planctomycetales bacterium]|nr:nicotinate-nucleotide adenylyltransferase [Planctomycetales bacterium]
MRIGVFGGSFDPVHNGHLLLAESCREQGKLDRVFLIPAVVSPHKQDDLPADGNDRLEMLRLAVGGNEHFEVSDLELQRGGVSYTVDTLTAIASKHPGDDLFFMMGADSLLDFPNWREPQAICRLASVLVVARPDCPNPDLECLREFGEGVVDSSRIVDMPRVDYSSTEIRSRVRRGKSIRYRTPRSVEKYIEAKRLYRATE